MCFNLVKFLVLLLSGLTAVTLSHSQVNSGPVEVTQEISGKINQEIAKSIGPLKTKMRKLKESEVAIEFASDTFMIEEYQQKYIDYDYSTAGMRNATYDAAYKYDSLLNKYYRKLLIVLKPADKAALINAEKSWLVYRDNELKLISTISKDEYYGGGTLQQLTDASEYLNLIKERAIRIYEYYVRATQSE